MSDATITLIIIACVSILYITERHSVAVTTVLGMLALIFTGILDFNEAFACFTSTNVMLVLGMIIIVESLLDSGVAEKGRRFCLFTALFGAALLVFPVTARFAPLAVLPVSLWLLRRIGGNKKAVLEEWKAKLEAR